MESRETRTEDEFLGGREHVHAEGHLKPVDLELQPLAELLEGRHLEVGVGYRRRRLWCASGLFRDARASTEAQRRD